MNNEQRTWWHITIGGYGSFLFEGTKTEAEEMRVHKSQWEGGAGRKRLATAEEIAKETA